MREDAEVREEAGILTRAGTWLSHPILLIALLSAGIIRPISGNRLPHADDLGFHQLRLAELLHLVENGTFFTRWQPDLALGYGFPLFNYYAPLSYYVALPFAWLTDVPTAIQWTMALSIFGAGCTMYLLLRDAVSPFAALFGAAAYMYAPYLSFDALFRANLGEVVAFAWMPLALWAIGRVGTFGTQHVPHNPARYTVFAALAYAAVILSHNVFALLFSPVLLLYGLLKSRYRAILAIVLGLAASAFFWLPALLETELVSFGRMQNNPALQVENNFLTLREILTLPRIPWRDLLNPSPPPALGLFFVATALIPLVALSKIKKADQAIIALFTAIALAIIFLLLPISAPLWDFPLLSQIQFPWRLNAIAALALAILIGFAAEIVCDTQKYRTQSSTEKTLSVSLSLSVSLCGLFLLTATTWQYLFPPYGNKTPTTIADITPWEVATGTLGTTADGEYLPATVREMPSEPRTEWIVFGGTVVEQDIGINSAEITLQTPNQATLTYNQFHFPGWKATLNGTTTPITPSDPHGLITVSISPGSHELRLQFDATPLRLGAGVISTVGLLLVGFLLSRSFRWNGASVHKRRSFGEASSLWGTTPLVLVALVTLIMPLFRPNRHANTPPQHRFNDNMHLLQTTAPTAVRADQPIELTLHWTAAQSAGAWYKTSVALRDANGVLWSDKQSSTPRRHRNPIDTRFWQTGTYAEDRHVVYALPGTPAGEYELFVRIFDRDSLQPLALENSTVTEVEIGRITLAPPRQTPALTPRIPIENAQTVPALVGYETDRVEARPGDPLLLALFWQTADRRVFTPQIHLLSDEGIFYPLPSDAEYTIENALQTRHLFRIPRDLPGGDYRWQVNGWISADFLAITAPDRRFTPPPVAVEDGTSLTVANLYGYTISQTETDIEMQIVWEITETTETPWHIFVHLLDETDAILTQSDGEAANRSRPATGWLPGEYIIDEHRLVLEEIPENVRLRIGLYDPATGQQPAAPVILTLPQSQR